MFNDPAFIQEFTDFCANLKVKTALEVGYGSGELVEALRRAGIEAEGIDKSIELSNNKQAKYLYNVAWEEFTPKKKYDIVYSSGVIEHYKFSSEMNEFLKRIAEFSRKYVLTIAPNTNCAAYMNAKAKTAASWKDELDFTPVSLATIHDLAELKVKESGTMAAEWPRRFGPESSEPYLVYCLAIVPKTASKIMPKAEKR